MNVGDGNKTGDIRSRDSAGRDITHIGTDARALAEILWRIDARMDAQRAEDMQDRERRQNEVDFQWEMIGQSITVLRQQSNEVQMQVNAMQTQAAHIQLHVSRVERLAQFNRAMNVVTTSIMILLAVAVIVMLFHLGPTLIGLAVALGA